ncbi:MAG: peptidoglycan-binding protein [Actinomycetota bacterium]|nr:peptidoglycan-binding protein [Actinomycetota bacterium]
MLKGIDVSGASVDWREVRGAGSRFGGFKLSEGEDFRHPQGTRGRYQEAHQAGLFVMPYHFLRPKRRDPTLETQFYLRCLRSLGYPSKGDLPPVIDIEVTDLSPAATLTYLVGACRHLLARNPHRRGIIIYGSPAFLDQIGVGSSQFLREQTGKKKIRWWIAHEGPAPGHPRLPKGIDSFLFHQHELDTTATGVSGAADLNVARPDIDEKKLRGIMHGGGAGRRSAPQAKAARKPAKAKDRVREAQRLLKQIGWPIAVDGDMGPQTKQALRDFKRGYAFTPAYTSFNTAISPVTMRRIEKSAKLGGACSEHFKFREFASSRSGWIRTHRDLVRGLEKLRAEVGHPIGIFSGFRDFKLGASKSQHKFGNGIDPAARLPLDACKRVKRFSGIGLEPGTSEVRHLDVRHVGPNTTPGATPGNPNVFNDNF